MAVRRRVTWQLEIAFAGFQARNSLRRSRDTLERCAEVRHLNQRKHESDDPEDVHVREQRDEAEHGDKFGLQLVALVSDVFRQRMQTEEEDAEPENRNRQEDGARYQKHIRLARLRNEHRQMLNR